MGPGRRFHCQRVVAMEEALYSGRPAEVRCDKKDSCKRKRNGKRTPVETVLHSVIVYPGFMHWWRQAKLDSRIKSITHAFITSKHSPVWAYTLQLEYYWPIIARFKRSLLPIMNAILERDKETLLFLRTALRSFSPAKGHRHRLSWFKYNKFYAWHLAQKKVIG